MKLNVAVIGCGSWGRNHARVYDELDNANLVAVAGYSEEVFEELGFEHSQWIEGFSSWAFSVVEVSEKAACVFGVDGV